MKAAHNGVINFSVLDGWWIEGCVEGLTGWAIGPSPDQAVKKSKEGKEKSRISTTSWNTQLFQNSTRNATVG